MSEPSSSTLGKSTLKSTKRHSLLPKQTVKYPMPIRRNPSIPILPEPKRRTSLATRRASLAKQPASSADEKPIPQSNTTDVSFISKFLDTFTFDQSSDDVSCPPPRFERSLAVPVVDDTTPERTSVVLTVQDWMQRCPGVTNIKWLENHLLHVIWKKVGYLYHNRSSQFTLTATSVQKEIMWRYAYEQKPRRSFYRQLYNGDERSGYCHVCVVAAVTKSKTVPTLNRLLVSDGWYTILLNVDEPLSRLIEQGKIYPGQKLRVACMEGDSKEEKREPWEGNLLEMRVSVNCVRRAERIEKLGRTKCNLFLININSVQEGIVPGIRACVERVYPKRYKFKKDKQLLTEREFNCLMEQKKEEIEKEYQSLRMNCTEAGDMSQTLAQFQGDKREELEYLVLLNFRLIDGMQRTGQANHIAASIWMSPHEETDELKERKWYDFFGLKGKKIGGRMQLESSWKKSIRALRGDYELPKEFEDRKVISIRDCLERQSGDEIDIVCCVLKKNDEEMYVTDTSLTTCLVKRVSVDKRPWDDLRVICLRNIHIESVYHENVVLKETPLTEILRDGRTEDEKQSIKVLEQVVLSFPGQFQMLQRAIDHLTSNLFEVDMNQCQEVLLANEIRKKDDIIQKQRAQIEELQLRLQQTGGKCE